MAINHNPENLKIGQKVLFEGKETVLLDFTGPTTCLIRYEKKYWDIRVKEGFWNKLFNITEVFESTYESTTQCSIWNLKPIK